MYVSGGGGGEIRERKIQFFSYLYFHHIQMLATQKNRAKSIFNKNKKKKKEKNKMKFPKCARKTK